MPRQTTRHNRADVHRREAPQDRPNLVDDLSSGGGFGACDCDCETRGAILDCTECPDPGAPLRWQFVQPAASTLWDRSTIVLEYDAGCCWESDDIDVDCGGGYGPDQFYWRLCLAVDCCDILRGTLTYSKRGGAGCPDAVVVYRSVFPWRCNCENTLYLDERASSGLEAEQLAALPCSICIAPGASSCNTLGNVPDALVVSMPDWACPGSTVSCGTEQVLRKPWYCACEWNVTCAQSELANTAYDLWLVYGDSLSLADECSNLAFTEWCVLSTEQWYLFYLAQEFLGSTSCLAAYAGGAGENPADGPVELADAVAGVSNPGCFGGPVTISV